MAEDGVGPEEGQVHAVVASLLDSLSHAGGPVLVVSERQQNAMAQQQLGRPVQVDVGAIGDVEATRFDQLHQGQLVAEEVGRALTESVGPVEGHDPGTVVEVGAPAAPAFVEVVAAPQVVGLPRGDGVEDHVRRAAGVVSYGERDVMLLAAAADQLEEVVARRPGAVDPQSQGRSPARLHRVRGGEHVGRRLHLARDLRRTGHQTCACTAVPTRAVRLDVERWCPARDVQVDGVARLGAHGVSETLQVSLVLWPADAPIGRAGAGVLRLHPGGGDSPGAARCPGREVRRSTLGGSAPGRHQPPCLPGRGRTGCGPGAEGSQNSDGDEPGGAQPPPAAARGWEHHHVLRRPGRSRLALSRCDHTSK